MTRAFDHDLDIPVPGALRKLTESYKFLDLADIGRVSQAARAAGIT